MEENRTPSRDLSAGHPIIPQGADYEYDEAHDDLTATAPAQTSAPHRVDPPEVSPGAGGDYGYDEAHDFGPS